MAALVSLYDMLKFHAENFCRVSSLLGQFSMDIASGRPTREENWSVIGTELRALEPMCKELGLSSTLAQLKRVQGMVKNIDHHTFNLHSFGDELIQIQIRMNDELEARLLFAVEAERSDYFIEGQFAISVVERFPDASFDIDEAGKCFALERPTACVFHLMRVTEYGLQAIGKVIGIKDERPNWDPIISKIDAELKRDYKDRQFKGQADFLAHVSSHLHAVKVAWRNRAMHIERKHTMEEAREIYGATRGLMRYVSENITA